MKEVVYLVGRFGLRLERESWADGYSHRAGRFCASFVACKSHYFVIWCGPVLLASFANWDG